MFKRIELISSEIVTAEEQAQQEESTECNRHRVSLT